MWSKLTDLIGKIVKIGLQQLAFCDNLNQWTKTYIKYVFKLFYFVFLFRTFFYKFSSEFVIYAILLFITTKNAITRNVDDKQLQLLETIPPNQSVLFLKLIPNIDQPGLNICQWIFEAKISRLLYFIFVIKIKLI